MIDDRDRRSRRDPDHIKDLRNCRDVDPFQTTIRGLASYTVPKIDVLVSATVRSQPPLARVGHLAGAEHGDPEHRSDGCRRERLATGNTTVAILDNDHRLYADNRRTQIDMRFAKIFRFGTRRADVGVDLGNLLNTNYATTYENTYQYSVGNTALGGTWNNPTAIYTPRFVRWNLTVGLLTVLWDSGFGPSFESRIQKSGSWLTMPRNSSRVSSASSDRARSLERSLSVSSRSRDRRATCSARSSRRVSSAVARSSRRTWSSSTLSRLIILGDCAGAEPADCPSVLRQLLPVHRRHGPEPG